MFQPIESDPRTIVFCPPNMVPDFENEINFMNIKRNPVKAIGDVSLSGPQLVAFLYKLCTRLSPAKCEGIGLKFHELDELVSENRVSFECLQKLNYVVDAIDRNHHTDALFHYQQLYDRFPFQLANWGRGIYLLVHELFGPKAVKKEEDTEEIGEF